MHKNNFTFRPVLKPTIFGNHMLRLSNVGEACASPTEQFSRSSDKPPEPDPDLEVKLKTEWPPILRWMIEGCLDWRKNRLRAPQLRQGGDW